MSNDNKNNATAMTPVHKYQDGNPSRCKSKNKDIKTMAEPVSGCSKINNTGNAIIPIPIACSLRVLKCVCVSVIYLAHIKATVVLTNSKGCKYIPTNVYLSHCPF